MGSSCCGRLGVTMVSWGHAIIALSLLSATIVYGKFCNVFTPDYTYSRHNPEYFYGTIFDSALSISFFGCIGAVLCIVCLFLTICLRPKNIAGFILGGITTLFAIAVIISEGFLYNGVFRESTQIDNFRNNTKAQNYITNSIETLYKQAYENFKGTAEFNTDPNVVNALTWDQYANEYLGKTLDYNGGKKCYQYADLWNVAPNTIYITIARETSKIVGRLISQNSTILEVQIGSLLVNDTTGYTASNRACWGTSDSEYECMILSAIQPNTPIYSNQPFTITQYIVSGPYIDSIDEGVDVHYKVSRFPYGFTILSLDEIQAQYNKLATDVPGPFVYTTLTNYYPSGSIENYFKLQKQFHEEIPSLYSNQNYWCSSIPQSWDDAFSSTEFSMPKCIGNYPISQFPLPAADPFMNVGVYGEIEHEYESHTARAEIFNFLDYARLAQFALASLVIQIVGIVFWFIGKCIEQCCGQGDDTSDAKA